MKRVLVLGCGPAALIAAQAAKECGADVRLYSVSKTKSVIYGAQFLYEPIPGVCESSPDGMLHNIFLGDVEVYRKKIYGDPTIRTTWDNKNQVETEPVWSLEYAYSVLWDRFQHLIEEQEASCHNLYEMLNDGWDYVFSSVPLPVLCKKRYEHVFPKYQVRILRQSHQQRLMPGESNLCIYNGLPEDTWFRFSHMFGRNGGFEMPSWNMADGSVLISKPQQATCDCWPEVTRIGRYGAWNFDINTHHSWGIVMEAMSGTRIVEGAV